MIVGDGYYRLMNGDEKVPALFERRTAAATLYGNVVDFSDQKEGYVRSVAQAGGTEAGYGLLNIETARGTDVCFAAYRPGTHRDGRLETDSLQALVLNDGEKVRALYLGGGTTLAFGAALLARNSAGLASLEQQPDGSFLVANPSPGAADITVKLPTFAVPVKLHLQANAKSELTATGKTKP